MRPTYHQGVNHHLIFPESMADAALHERTLPGVLSWPEFDAVDLFCAGDDEQMAREAALIRASGKYIVYNSPLLYQIDGCDPNATDEQTISATRAEALRHLNAAQACGAHKINISSGQYTGEADRARAWEGWIGFLTWFGIEAGARDLEVVIEPFDQSIGKNLLVGPTRDAVRSVVEARGRGAEAVSLMIDMGHLPIMGESFSEALELSRPYLKHVHLGSAVIGDPSHPLYGDCHPPISLPEGEHDVNDLARFLEGLERIGYFCCGEPSVTVEMRPYPDLSERGSALKALSLIDEAWTMIGK